MSDLLLTHGNRAEALLYLLRRYPAGVTRSQLSEYWYRGKRGQPIKLGWEGRNAISELRHDYHIEHITLEGQSAWVLRGKKVAPGGQLTLALAG